jgi:hypothetical protein
MKHHANKLLSSALVCSIAVSMLGMITPRLAAGQFYRNEPMINTRQLIVRGATADPIGVAVDSERSVAITIEQCTSVDGDSVSVVNRQELARAGIYVKASAKITKCHFSFTVNVEAQSINGIARRIEFTTTTEHSYVDLTILARQLAAQSFPTVALVSSHTVPADVVIGAPQPIPYSQAFALLDGLFQDISAIQINSLNLDANVANANRLDALIQQFQVAIQYSQALGIQNAAAAQQSSAYSSSGALQAQLMNQESQLIDLSLAAQREVLQAQKALDSLPTTATEARAAATQTLQLANDQVTSINAQITSVKNMLSTNAAAAPTYSPPAPTPVAFSTPILNPSLPLGSSSSPFSPSFPASKQMENQVNLLWERLANLVSTLTQTNNTANIYLVKFDTGILSDAKKKDHQLLTTQYSLTCNRTSKEDQTYFSEHLQERPQVLDLFPRKAAVNIANEKYRDSRLNLAAFLSFFSIGANAAYNREHLQITQALGQSAYITGFGIQTDSFGWVFGRTLGEDVPAPGDRTTFALVSYPQGCGEARINLVNAEWGKSMRVVPQTSEAIRVAQQWPSQPTEQNKERCPQCQVGVAYTPGEFDPANPASSNTNKVTVDITFDSDLEREETVSVNGNIISRARDTFGRATLKNPLAANGVAGGSGGLLESGTLDAGTWLPISSREIILNLNPVAYRGRFPSIILNSPKGSIDITNHITHATIGGAKYICPASKSKPDEHSCLPVLPPIGRLHPTVKTFSVDRWRLSDTHYHLLFKAQDNQRPVAATPPLISLSAIQVVRGSLDEPWSAHASVIAIQDENVYPLQCEPKGEFLDCDAGDLKTSAGAMKNRTPETVPPTYDPMRRTEFDIFDGEHLEAPIAGSVTLQNCGDPNTCSGTAILHWDQPEWFADDNYKEGIKDAAGKPMKEFWKYHLILVNVNEKQTAQLENLSPAPIMCRAIPGEPDQEECWTDIIIPKNDFVKVRNFMSFNVLESGTKVLNNRTIGIKNLLINITPLISNIENDQKHFWGQNLVFDQITVGSKPRVIAIVCDKLGRTCYVPDKNGFADSDEGFLNFKAGDELVEFLKIDDKGILAPVAAHVAKPAEPGKGNVTQTPSPGTQPPSLLININHALRLSTDQ